MKCQWCGNTSGILDNNGGCISCGGFTESTIVKKSPFIPHQNGNGYYQVTESTYYLNYLGILSVNEAREKLLHG